MKGFGWFKKKEQKAATRQVPAATVQTQVPAPKTNLRRKNNIEAFQDTMSRMEQDPVLKKRAEDSAGRTLVYAAHTLSEKSPSAKASRVVVQEATTVQAARELKKLYARVALLNFANPLEPGGGVLRGANTQEESLCRASTLYPCLVGPCAAEYYRYHQAMPRIGNCFLNSDRLVYSPDVTFFKEEVSPDPFDDQLHLELCYTDDWFTADVITCAAPYFPAGQLPIAESELRNILIERIQNILECAIDQDAEALVLGAFGCGAFHNPPMVVADAFRTVLLQPRYRNAFEEIRFAIKRTDPFFCPNIEAFEIKLSAFPEECLFSEERNKRRFFE